ncbi:MAG: hypothetical protein GOMPHAMPRED_003330 [Gomphillus americanus]|uniref:DNA helicase n=1 Tax=Gomphillus americanus TaxID=1940652 RepID=A0A8H3EFQ9_9LECA|nr:MAG: hypothetical protein GOMPHAMPRED_003330 [Gomphillus americanus]
MAESSALSSIDSDTNPIANVVQTQQNDSEKNARTNDDKLATLSVDQVALQAREKFGDEERPFKRRRTTDILTPQQSNSRAASPPWKKSGIEGPTAFVLDGKRKSARTNTLPLELQPQGKKRATRASISHTPNVQSKYSSTRRTELATPTTPASATKSSNPKTRHSRNLSSSAQPSKQSPLKKLVDGTKSSHKAGDPSQRRGNSRQSQSPSRRRSFHTVSNGRSVHQITRRSSKIQLVDTEPSDSEDERQKSDEEEESEIDLIPFTPDPNQKPQRLRLRFNVSPPKAQHPLHVDSNRKYTSFREWLDTEGPLCEGEASNHMTKAEIAQEAEVRRKIELAQKPGGLLDEALPRIKDAEIGDSREPPQQYTRHDYTVAHALRFQQLLEREHRKHVLNARKYAYDAQAKWIASQPKSVEEFEAEQKRYDDEVAFATMKQCIQDLATKWGLFRQEAYMWRLERWKEEQDALGKENLRRVIQESEALLDSRLWHNSEGSGSEEDNSEDGSDEDGDVEDNMSLDGSGSEEERVENSDDDLTAEELRRKYTRTAGSLDKSPPRHSVHKTSADISMVDASILDEQEEENDSDAIMKGLNFEDEEVKARIAQAERDDSQANFSEDESTDMDSESEVDSDEEYSAEGSDGSEDEDVGLGALLAGYSKSRIAKPKSEANTDGFSPSVAQISITNGDASLDNEVHHIPDAAQVQTPVSNNEGPMNNHKSIDHSPDENCSGPRVAVTNEAETSMDVDMQVISAEQDDHVSMPATPISFDLDKKHIPALKVPHLLRATLRDYQKEGFNWLADRYEHDANGILADEMGLGKTIQTITLLAYLALKHEVWGPHLIVVPTSVILNWEMEFKKFLPGFKILSYYGNPEERRTKRIGWLDNDRWNVVITSYNLAVTDEFSFKRRPWHYFILDEAHNIKNFRSKRWQTLLTFRSHSRLLLTGTPLQNNLEELWALLFFLVGQDKAEDFLGRQEFALLFKKPADQILEDDQQHLDAEAREQVQKLHQILRPRLLRRLKADVEKQMPGKYEHIVHCRLSKRQRHLYDGFLSRTQTRETLARGNYLSIINCLMQLRKVCNHPDLFETRPIVTSFAMQRSVAAAFESLDFFVRRRCLPDRTKMVDLDVVDLVPGANGPVSALDTIQKARLNALFRLRELVYYQTTHAQIKKSMVLDGSTAASALRSMDNKSKSTVLDDLQHRVYLTSLRSQRRPLYSYSLAQRLLISLRSFPVSSKPKHRDGMLDWFSSQSTILADMVKSLDKRSELMQDYLVKFTCTTPAVVAPDLFELTFGKPVVHQLREVKTIYTTKAFKEASIRQAIAFPDKRLLQFDCGKLQKLDELLRKLQAGGHRALIFTQMAKVLDILEQFLNIHGHRYLRLDGQTKIENRQLLTERFNSDPSILTFILSSRAGGLGLNLTGADAVIFYDLDWNPAMDKQCQDRAHRIGQTRDVHIYRFVSEHTIEANILRKSNQKRLLDEVVIGEGDFTTDYFNKPSNPRDLFDDANLEDTDVVASAAFDRVLGIDNGNSDSVTAKLLSQAEDREDAVAARVAEREVEIADQADFDEKEPTSNKTTRPSSRHGERVITVDDTVQEAAADNNNIAHQPSKLWLSGEVNARTDMAIDIFKEKSVIGVDRHMVEYLEWEGKDTVFVPPDINKKKKQKKKAR